LASRLGAGSLAGTMICPNHPCCFTPDENGPPPVVPDEAKMKDPQKSPGVWSLSPDLLAHCVESCPFDQNIMLRQVSRRMNWVVIRQAQFSANGRFVNGTTHYRADKQKEETTREVEMGNEREARGRFRLNFIIFLNVLLGAAQLGVAGSSVNKDCSEPLGVILLICGALNFVQVLSFTLWGCPEEVLHPLDEWEDEEFGWPLYLVGLLVWLSFVCDFTLWIVMQMLYFKASLSCDNNLEIMTLVSIIFRWVMLITYICVSLNHLMDKIHQENKRKFGRNPYKRYKSDSRALRGLFGMTGGQADEQEATGDVHIELSNADYPASTSQQQPAPFSDSRGNVENESRGNDHHVV